MLKDFLQYVVDEFSKVQIIYDDSRTFSSRPLTQLTTPLQKPLHFNTLQSFVQFANRQLENLVEVKNLIAHVVDEKEVLLLSEDVDCYAQRICYAKATTALQPEAFPFERYLSIEDFLIKLRTRFITDAAVDDLIRVIGNISSESKMEVTDDGFTQTVGQKAGVVLKTRAELPAEIMLAPFRTFLEVQQPPSPFFVRGIKTSDNPMTLPQLALFPTDGGAWRMEAVSRIADYLRSQLDESIKVLS